MRYWDFFSQLTVNEKILYGFGTVVEKFFSTLTGYKHLADRRIFLDKLSRHGYQFSQRDKNIFVEKKEIRIELREGGSDYEVFDQIFMVDEYKPVLDFFISNGIVIDTIIDAGCNIGMTTLRFLNMFPNAKAICIEPDPKNFAMLASNLSSYKENVVLLENALWDKEEELFLDFKFRDGKDWSRRVTDTLDRGGRAVIGLPLNSIIKKYNFSQIDFLKIDIEGSEEKIFRDGNDLSFLNVTKVLAIEIHDEFNCRDVIYGILIKKGFVLFNFRELTVAVNKLILKVD